MQTPKRLTGIEIPLELKRVISVSNERKPFMVVYSTDPHHKGGIIYEGIKLHSLVTSFDANDKIQHVGISVSQMELGIRQFKWHPDGSSEPNDEREIQYLEVYWGADRVGMGKESLNYFLSRLPQEPDARIVAQQRELESFLPRFRSETTEISDRQYRI